MGCSRVFKKKRKELIISELKKTKPLRNSKNIFLRGRRMICFLKKEINLIFSETKEENKSFFYFISKTNRFIYFNF